LASSRKDPAGEGFLIVDPSCGLSGDMFLACLFALGVKAREVERMVSKLPGLEPFRIVAGRVKRKGIAAMRARVRCTVKTKQRHLDDILRMIESSPLENRVKVLAAGTFTLLGAAEAKVHGIPLERVHFHEVGAVDSIVDIVGAAVAVSMLGFPRIYHRPFRLGSGTISFSHGKLPLPAPATVELLRGRTVRLDGDNGEVVTPTGAALMVALARELPLSFPFRPKRTVYAAGTREVGGEPGMLRIIEAEARKGEREVSIVRTTIDDMNPEQYGYLRERLAGEGVFEVYFTQLIMKKGRPGVEVTVLCEPAATDAVARLLFRETTTLGVRFAYETRFELERWTELRDTPFGGVQVKCARLPDGTVKAAPEYESCREVALSMGVPLSRVYEAACIGAEKLKGKKA
jgi:uncharacterized protein (TIGR00299 family) protein